MTDFVKSFWKHVAEDFMVADIVGQTYVAIYDVVVVHICVDNKSHDTDKSSKLKNSENNVVGFYFGRTWSSVFNAGWIWHLGFSGLRA